MRDRGAPDDCSYLDNFRQSSSLQPIWPAGLQVHVRMGMTHACMTLLPPARLAGINAQSPCRGLCRDPGATIAQVLEDIL